MTKNATVSEIIGFNGKPSITEAWPLYRFHFRALAAVHELGRSKYSAFSWQNNPNASNSTIENNVDALMRHIALHKAGYTQDAEGFPHIYHIACRIGMLLTTWYRQIFWSIPTYDRPDTFPDCEKVLNTYLTAVPSTAFSSETAPWLAMLHLTPEEIISCLKMYLTDGKQVRQSIDDTSSIYAEEPKKFLIYILDLMQLQLMTLVQTTIPEYSDCLPLDLATMQPEEKERFHQSRRHHYFTKLTPCDVLQYLSAKLLHYVHSEMETTPEFISLTRTDAQIAELVASYKKKV